MPLLAVRCPTLDMSEFTTHQLLYKASLSDTAAGDVDTLLQCMTCVAMPVMMVYPESSV
jgi:hypothetical protein